MPKFKTIAIDSTSEFARLTFSFDMKKHAGDFTAAKEKIRAVNNYPGATERINMIVRRLKDYRSAGMEVVLIAHEQLEKVYAKGGMIGPKGSPPPDPVAVKGWPDLPGSRCPDEVMRACDNVFRVRNVNGSPVWIARLEPVGGGGDYYEVKDRFNAQAIRNGLLPSSYEELAKAALANPLCNFRPPYIWLLYGNPGIGKTRSLLTFPRPMKIFDIDRGCSVISKEVDEANGEIVIAEYNSEECDDYPRFLSELEASLGS